MREKVFTYIQKKYKAAPEYPWVKYDSNAVFRHSDNKKWFALVMEVERKKLGLSGSESVHVINLKIDDAVFHDVLVGEEGILPAYHMNKEHWISVLLDGTVEEDRVYNLIDVSFLATASKKKKEEPCQPKEWSATGYIQYLSDLIPAKDSLKIVKTEAKKFYKEHTAHECYVIYPFLYQSDNFQIQEVGVFLAGFIADEYPDALVFLHDTVSLHESWKVQEVLAMAFDNYCAKIEYENALPVIKEWFIDENANIRRAASEGLRVWTSRPYFREHPETAIALLASHKNDESEYVRKSAGNSLRDISKKFPELVAAELGTWDITNKRILQVYKLAGKFLW